MENKMMKILINLFFITLFTINSSNIIFAQIKFKNKQTCYLELHLDNNQ